MELKLAKSCTSMNVLRLRLVHETKCLLGPVNIGSEEMVTINDLAQMAINIFKIIMFRLRIFMVMLLPKNMGLNAHWCNGSKPDNGIV